MKRIMMIAAVMGLMLTAQMADAQSRGDRNNNRKEYRQDNGRRGGQGHYGKGYAVKHRHHRHHRAAMHHRRMRAHRMHHRHMHRAHARRAYVYRTHRGCF